MNTLGYSKGLKGSVITCLGPRLVGLSTTPIFDYIMCVKFEFDLNGVFFSTKKT